MSHEKGRQLYEVMYDQSLSIEERNNLLKLFILDPHYQSILMIAREIFKQEGKVNKPEK